jgi:hypothetical protein
MMESSVILLYVTSSRLGEGTWNGTTKSFIINWQNQVRLYKKHAPPSDHFSNGQKRIMLHAVNSIMELRQVNNTADQMGTTLGSMLTYDAYTTLLLSAASAYDDQIKATRSRRHVMIHEIQHDKSGTDDDHYHGNDAFLTLIAQLVPFMHMPPTFVPIWFQINFE